MFSPATSIMKAVTISSQLYNFCVRRPLQRHSLSGTTVGSRLPWSTISDFIGRPRLTATPRLLNVRHYPSKSKVGTKAPGPYNFSGSSTRLINCSLPERKIYTVGGTRHLTYSQTSMQGSILQTTLPYAEDEQLSLIMSSEGLEEVYSVPACGLSSIRGPRQSMRHASAIVPRFLEVPMIGDHVAKYCRDRIHSTLAEVLEVVMENMNDTNDKDTCEEEWRRAFSKCFLQVDDEVGGKAGRGPHVAPETTGSSAIVAIVCPSSIVIANCGDSRVVLYRDTKSVPLSVDHKPIREDECTRIEAAGGKVIKMTGLSGVNGFLAKQDEKHSWVSLSVSRAIGDGYWKPWVISEPEVMFIPRTEKDRILILVSTGLWDVMTNQEACEIAENKIRFCHENSCVEPHVERCEGVDPAAKAAAECLSKLAVKRGSKDNISVLVIDLEAQP